MSARRADVMVVGGGPIGLAIANALGLRGVDVLLVEQEAGVAELPRAVSIDDEAMRLAQALGLLEETRAVVLPGTGTKYYGARGQELAYVRGPERQRYGHPVKNPLDHAEFQRVLLDGTRRFSNVELRHDTRFLELEQDADGVTARIQTGGGEVEEVRARYLVGADGGRSPVRVAIGLEPMEGSAFEERWLVLDTVNDPHDERFAMHHGDPRRPRVVIVGREGRCRYEFLVHEDEEPADDALLAFATELVRPYRALDPADVVRCTIYKFYALVARTFRAGNVFLAGDAAHMMPPFAGQGLNSGLRDAANLSWKLAAVLDGRAGGELLDSYTEERRPHVSAMVRLSVRLGSVMMTLSRARAELRDASLTFGRRVPVFGRFVFREMRHKPPAHFDDGFLVGAAPAGDMIVQPWVLDGGGGLVRLDEALGAGFALVGVEVAPTALDDLCAPLWERLGTARVHVRLDDRLPARDTRAAAVADADGLLAEQLSGVRGKILLVRPDRFIAGMFAPAQERAFAAELERRLGVPAATAMDVA